MARISVISVLICVTNVAASGQEVALSNEMSIREEIAQLKASLSVEISTRKKLEESVRNMYNVQDDIKQQFDLLYGHIVALRGQKVAFSARVEQSYEDILPWATIVFANIETNIGKAYNGANGEFTAPTSGTYVFYSNILSAAGKVIETSLQVNGLNQMYLYSGGNYRGSGSNMAVLNINRGDVVKMVKHGPWGTKPFYIHHAWSTFSGYLLQTEN